MDILNRAKGKLYRSAFSAAGKVGSCKIENTIVLAGSPRSGTTLLLEALSMLPDYKVINEPLLNQRLREKHHLYSRSYIPAGLSASEQREFFLQVLHGQMDPSARWVFQSDSGIRRIIEHGTKRKLLVKFCRVNRLLPWLAEQFNTRGIIFIIRHPCAVVNSMMRYGQWKKWAEKYVRENKHNPFSSVYIRNLPEEVQEVFTPVIERVSTQAEALTLIWCLDQYLPLIHAHNPPGILVPYERLVMNNYDEMMRITSSLDVKVNSRMLKTLNKPSSSVKGEVKENAYAQLSKWKLQLTSRQIDDILSIVEETGLSRFYSDSIEPDYQQLSLLQNTSENATSEKQPCNNPSYTFTE